MQTGLWWASASDIRSAGVLRRAVPLARFGCAEHVLQFGAWLLRKSPDGSVRQWVLSFPWPLRLLFAARPELLTRVLAVVTRALSTGLARRARLRTSRAETGLVTFVQRHGSALNLI